MQLLPTVPHFDAKFCSFPCTTSNYLSLNLSTSNTQAAIDRRSNIFELLSAKASCSPRPISSSGRGSPSSAPAGRCLAAENGNSFATNGNNRSGNGNGAPDSGDAGTGKQDTPQDSPIVPEPCIVALNSMSEDLHWLASGYGTIEGDKCDWSARRKQPQKAFATPKKAEVRLRNEIQLSAYPNHIGENIKDLDTFMTTYLAGAVGGLHLLPAYPSSGDGGFAPITYQEIEPEFGTWADVESLSERFDLCLEFMVNHISPASEQFQDFLAKGDESEYATMFVDWDKFWPKGRPSESDLDLIRTRKPEQPFIEMEMGDGSTRRLWCTFGPQQIDIDPFSVPGRKFVKDSLASLCTRGAKLVRLDAFAYVTKLPGTPCFFHEPEVWQLLDMVEDIVHEHDTGLLCEVHEEYTTNIKLAEEGYWVYDFALPLLVLHAFEFNVAVNLKNWLMICPRRQITVLDTHDGMGVDDITGLAAVCDVEELQETVTTHLGCDPNFKYYFDTNNGGYNSSAHQYNCTYFSALQNKSRHYLLARAIQFWTPGIPMVYYVGLLAGKNDHTAVQEQQTGRAINRHRYSMEEAAAATEKPVVRALIQLMRFRNTHPAFNGQMTLNDTAEDHILEVAWTAGVQRAELLCDLKNMSFQVFATGPSDEDGVMHVKRYTLNGYDTAVPESEAAESSADEEDEDAVCRPLEI